MGTGQLLREHLQQLAPKLEEQITTINNYDDIVLTDEETAEALRVGREKKALDIAKKEYWNKITAEPIIYRYTSEGVKKALANSINSHGKKYVIDADNEYQVDQLCYYFAGDARFNGNLEKGIILMGGLGVGKSHLMSFFFQNQMRCYRMASCRQNSRSQSMMRPCWSPLMRVIRSAGLPSATRSTLAASPCRAVGTMSKRTRP